MSEPCLSPIAGEHAIEQVTFGIDIVEPIAPHSIQKLFKFAQSEEITKALPFCVREKSSSVRLPLPPFIGASTPRTVNSGLILMDNLDSANMRKCMYFGDGIQIIYKEYVNWKTTIAEVQNLLRILLQERTITISGIFLEYKDSFCEAAAGENTLPLKSIIKPNNIFVPQKGVGKANLSWKNTFMFAETALKSAQHRKAGGRIKRQLLNEITMEYGPKGPKDLIRLSCSARHRYVFPVDKKMVFSKNKKEKNLAMICTWFSELHDENVLTLRQIFSERTLERIGFAVGSKQ